MATATFDLGSAANGRISAFVTYDDVTNVVSTLTVTNNTGHSVQPVCILRTPTLTSRPIPTGTSTQAVNGVTIVPRTGDDGGTILTLSVASGFNVPFAGNTP